MHRRTRLIFRRSLRQAMLWTLPPVMIVLVTWLIWGWHANHRLPATIARLRAQGIHLYPEDFPDDATVPHDQNAYYDLIDEIHPMVWGKGEGDLTAKPFAQQTAEEHAQIKAALAARQTLIDKIDLAQTRRTIVWPRDVFTDKWQHDHLPASGWVIFGRLLSGGTELAHAEGDDALALRDLRRLITLAQVFEPSPILIQHSLGSTFRGLAASGIESLSPGLSLKNPEVAADGGQLIKSLLDDQSSLECFSNSWQGYMTDEVRFDTDRDNLKALARLTSWERLLIKEGWARKRDQEMEVLVTIRSTNWQQAKKALAKSGHPVHYSDLSHHYSDLDIVAQSLSELQTFTFERYTNDINAVTHSRAALLLLAARLYNAQHDQFPKSSTDLVPNFLPAIPVDPFDVSGQPLNYRLDPDGPTVWSVGEDGRDDNASIFKNKDIVYGAAPPPPPSTRRATRAPSTRTAATKSQAVIDRTATATKPATQ